MLNSSVGETSGVAQPHYQVFVELKGVRNLTEEQRYKVNKYVIFPPVKCKVPTAAAPPLSQLYTNLFGCVILPYRFLV